MNDANIDRILGGLDEQQRAAALHSEGPALIVAGAGAGKTTTLVRRIAALVASGADPSSLLVLSFTRASAASILERARAFDPRAADVVGGTFHSVGAKIIRDYHSLFGLDRDFTLLDPGDAEDLLKRIAAGVETEKLRPQASTMAKIVSFARNTGRDIPDVIYDAHPNQIEMIDFILEVAELYVARKKEQKILDYDDLLEFWAKLCEHPQAGEAIRARFRHVIVDEHQDSNAIQLRIIYALGGEGGPGRSVTAVGDPSQSIYGFRGAAPGTMFDFRRHWPHTKVYLIERNYRSVPEIVEAADLIDRSMSERFERKLVSTRPSQGTRIRLNVVRDPDAEASLVVDSVMDRVEEGVPLSEMAILARSMRRIRGVELRLKERGIPYKVVGGIKIHEAAHIKDVIAPLKIVANPRDEGSWIRLLSLFPGIGPKSAARIAADCVSDDVARSLDALRAAAAKKEILSTAVAAVDAATLDLPAEAVRDVSNVLEHVLRVRFKDDWEGRRKDVDGIVDLAGGYETVADFLQTITLDVAIDRTAEVGYVTDDRLPITISTIHGSKGLEWSYVCIPSFMQGHLPSAFASTQEDIDEERRLFYVAVTRAKDELAFFRPSTVMAKGMLMPVQASPFEEIVSDLLERLHMGCSPRQEERFEVPSGFAIDGWD